MAKKMFFVASLMATFALMATSAAFGGEDIARWVDPFIGTAGTANCHPNACWPHGMVQAGPTSGTEEWKYCGGYQFADKELYGFVQDAISGTGCADLGDIRIQPFVGHGENERKTAEKADEKASPGYYSVRYPKQGIRTEIAVSPHVAFYRFAFDGKKDAHLLVDLQWGHCGCSGLSRHVISCTTAFPDATTMTGSLHLRQWVERDCHFAIRFGRPPTGSRTVPRKNPREKGEWREIDFDLADGEPLLVKVAISRTSVAAALANLDAEVPHWDFAKTASGVRDAWNAFFGRCQVEGTDAQKTAFYTSLYHLGIAPNVISDVGEEPFYSTLSFWDTFRAAHPLYTILEPERVPDMIDSSLKQGKKTGFLPIWCLWGKDNQCMIGTHSVPVIVDWFLKENENVKLWKCGNMELCNYENGNGTKDNSMISQSHNSTRSTCSTRLKNNTREYWLAAYAQIKDTLTKKHKNRRKEQWDLIDKYGYYPFDIIKGESVSRLLECAYDDWCAGVMAQKLGEQGTGKREQDESLKADAAFFFKRAENWRNVFDKSIGFMRGRDSNGKWREPFDPFALGHGATTANDFTEGNAFQYTWHVLHDPQGLIDAFGGRAKFGERLDSLFRQPESVAGMGKVLDVTGLIGQYAHGNEPSHHVAYFYQFAGRPGRTAEVVREVCDKFYRNTPDGLSGNDDCGQMSAWYVFSAMGFYPFNPCGGEYVIGAPQIPKVTIRVDNVKLWKCENMELCNYENGNGSKDNSIISQSHNFTVSQSHNSTCSTRLKTPTFTIVAKNLSKENKYVKSVTLNGKPLEGCSDSCPPIIRHADIMRGGELVFEMAPTP